MWYCASKRNWGSPTLLWSEQELLHSSRCGSCSIREVNIFLCGCQNQLWSFIHCLMLNKLEEVFLTIVCTGSEPRGQNTLIVREVIRYFEKNTVEILYFSASFVMDDYVACQPLWIFTNKPQHTFSSKSAIESNQKPSSHGNSLASGSFLGTHIEVLLRKL